MTVPPASFASIKAIVFDVFGTVVDWRTSVAGEVDALASRKGLSIDGAGFADAWRAQYGPHEPRPQRRFAMDPARSAAPDGPGSPAARIRLTGLSEAETDTLNKAWHRLRPWPDVIAGLTRLKQRFVIAPLSNGNVSLITNMAKHSGLPWDCVLGAELVRHYKPDPEVYQSAAHLLDLPPADLMMVAAHLTDLRSGEECRTPDRLRHETARVW